MMRTTLALLSCLSCLTLAVETSDRSAPSAAVAPVAERFLSPSETPVKLYRARRILEGHNARFDQHATIEAITELLPGPRFAFRIVRAEGSEYIREKVLLPMLQTERNTITGGRSADAAFTTANYDIVGGEPAGSGVFKLFIEPRRQEISLINGTAYVTHGGAELLKVEGRLAKSPSFWTKEVEIVRLYDRIAGVRVPVRLDTTASVRLAGDSQLSMTYDYEMINGIELR